VVITFCNLGGSSSPAGQVAELSIDGSYADENKIRFHLFELL